MKHALTKYREKHNGMTLHALAVLLGATKSMVWKWENGKAEPRPLYRHRIVNLTKGEVSASDLLLPESTA